MADPNSSNMFDNIRQLGGRAAGWVQERANGLRAAAQGAKTAYGDFMGDLDNGRPVGGTKDLRTAAQPAAMEAPAARTYVDPRLEANNAAAVRGHTAQVDAFNQRQGMRAGAQPPLEGGARTYVDPRFEANNAAAEAGQKAQIDGFNQRQGMRAAAQTPAGNFTPPEPQPQFNQPKPAGAPPVEPPNPASAIKNEGFGYRAGRTVAKGLRSFGPQALALAAGSGIRDTESTMYPNIDTSLPGTLGYVAKGEFGNAGKSLTKGAYEAAGDVVSGVAKTADAAAGMLGFKPDLQGKAISAMGGLRLRGGDAQPPKPVGAPTGSTPTSGAPGSDQVMTGRSSMDGTETLNGKGTVAKPAVAQNGLRVGRYGVPGVQTGDTSDPLGAQAKGILDEKARVQGTSQDRGVFGEMADQKALSQLDAGNARREAGLRANVKAGLEQQGQVLSSAAQQEAHDVQREGQQAQTALARAQMAHTQGNENEKRIEEATAAKVRASITPPDAAILNDPAKRAAHEDLVKQKTAEAQDIVNYTASAHGQTKAGLSSQNHRQIMLGIDAKARLEKARESGLAGVKDFFGSNRFDSRDAYSYLPKRDDSGKVAPAERDAIGGVYVRMGNGNRVQLSRVTNKTGETTGWNILGANEPIDADMMAMFKPAIDALEAKEKGKR